MKQIPSKAWLSYIGKLRRLNTTVANCMQAYVDQYGVSDSQKLIDVAYGLVTKYGEGSAALASEMYDALAELQGAHVPAAEPAETAEYGEVARMVNATKNSTPQLKSGVSRLVKRAGADTMLKNALRDGAEFAWVPSGDTCAFCMTLASRGWQRASKKAIKNGHAEHIHANCDCTYAIRFDSEVNVEGYDPDAYLKAYRDAGSDVNELRRIHYAENRERINAQKRAAYAARNEKKLSTIEGKSDKIELNNDRYVIAEPKISRFLLKPGAKHSAEFFNVGYTEQDSLALNADIYRQFDEAEKVDVRVSEDGTESFSIFMELGTTKKKRFRTVWQRDPGSDKPRFITAHREDK